MKKEYIIPTMQTIMLRQLQPLAESQGGPTGGSQQDPNMGGSGNSSRHHRNVWSEDEEEDF